jgi:Tol biopolymer transport system component
LAPLTLTRIARLKESRFCSKGSSTWQIAESPIEGGSPKELVRGRLWSPSVSPDGKFLTYLKLDGQGANPTLKFVVQNLADSSSREILAPKGTLSVKWTPDGHSLTYLRHDILADDLYLQPLPGGKAFRLMHFDDEPSLIYAFCWSRDGKKIAVTRARFNDSDFVLFTGLS